MKADFSRETCFGVSMLYPNTEAAQEFIDRAR